MKNLLVVALACISLAGCEMMRPYPEKPVDRWFKDGATNQQAKSKYAKCSYDVGMNKVDPTEKITLVNSCMVADGFFWGVPESEQKAWQQKVDDLKKQGYHLY